LSRYNYEELYNPRCEQNQSCFYEIDWQIDVKVEGLLLRQKRKKEKKLVLTAFAFNLEGQRVHTPATIVPDTTSMKKVVIADGQSRIALG
jgi:hypothetical protein